ncbi:MAG: IS607 family element RNA-guided endonuclease TnpB [Candidatus Dormibacteria bacterium]
MIVKQAYRFALEPGRLQRQALASHVGARRFAYNWALQEVKTSLAAREQEIAQTGKPVTEVAWSQFAMRRQWNAAKQEAAAWWGVNSKEAYSDGFAALASALKNWSDGRRGTRAGRPPGFPRFHKRGARDSCRFTTGAIRVEDARHITLPRLGRLGTGEDTSALRRRLDAGTATIGSATVRRVADRWFVSFTCSVERTVVADNGHQDTIGVDLGVLTLAALSDGTMVRGPRALRASLRRLRRAQRTVSRRVKWSSRRRRAVRRVARCHARVANVRRDHLHKLTTTLARNHGCVVIEDLNLQGMVRSARGTVAARGTNVAAKAGLNRSLADAGLGELRRMLTYKCAWYGSRLIVAPRFFASSKRCSSCGEIVADLPLAVRTYACAHCGLVLDRDVNAACNLVWWAETERTHASPAVRRETENACRVDVRPEPARAVDVEAGTGDVPEPSGDTRGPQRRHVSCVPC